MQSVNRLMPWLVRQLQGEGGAIRRSAAKRIREEVLRLPASDVAHGDVVTWLLARLRAEQDRRVREQLAEALWYFAAFHVQYGSPAERAMAARRCVVLVSSARQLRGRIRRTLVQRLRREYHTEVRRALGATLVALQAMRTAEQERERGDADPRGILGRLGLPNQCRSRSAILRYVQRDEATGDLFVVVPPDALAEGGRVRLPELKERLARVACERAGSLRKYFAVADVSWSSFRLLLKGACVPTLKHLAFLSHELRLAPETILGWSLIQRYGSRVRLVSEAPAA